MFACCDPRLPQLARISLTLKSLCGFGVSEIARATLMRPEAVAQRLVRAKRLLKVEHIALLVPTGEELSLRLSTVLQTLYLTFNEGYLTHQGASLIREDLIQESVRLTSMLLRDERTAQPETHATLALMLFHGARIASRTAEDGGMILLPDQDRRLWDRSLIQRGYHHLRAAMSGDRLTAFHLEAGIAGVHARARSFDETNWPEILALYDQLLLMKATPIVHLNRSVAVASVHGAEAGLEALGDHWRDGRLAHYYLAHAVRGELLFRAGRYEEAYEAFSLALQMECTEPERKLLEDKRRLAESHRGQR
jgi:RNA polymerase sigma-70 factor (ECF subfamily)